MAHGLRSISELHKASDYYGWVEGLYLAKDDCGVALRLRDGQGYEPESRKLWRSLCKDAELVIDVGAHTGVYSLDARRAGAKEVLSIEPYHLNHARLVMNLRHAGFDTAGAVLFAASDENRIQMLSVAAPGYYCSAGCKLGRAEPGVSAEFPVRVSRLDALLLEQYHAKVRVVKIDTERHGARVLRGMTKILAHRPDLILECIEDGMTEILEPLGYKFFKIHESRGLEPVDSLVPDAPFTFDSPNRYATVHGRA
jgi:FkbM family methyltransferase